MTSRARAGPIAALALGVSVVPARLPAQVCEGSAADSVAVERVAEGIIAADNARDIDAVLASYAPDAVLHPPGEAPVRGRAAIRPRYEALFAGFDPAIVARVDEISVCGDLAVVAGHNGGALRARDGAESRRLSDAYVMVLERTAEGWRIARLMWHPDGS